MNFFYLNDSPLRVTEDGRLGIFAKSMTGLAEYAKRWPGRVYVSSLEAPLPAQADDPQLKWADDALASDLEFISQVDPPTLSQLEADLVMHSVVGPRSEALLGHGFKVIFTDDWSPAVRLEVGLVTSRSALDRARIRVGALRRTHRLDALARRADGFQCNGHSAAEHYKSVNPSTHMYFDHRMRASDLVAANGREYWQGDRPLRIAYSGRLTEIKGVKFIEPFVTELERRGIDFEFTIIGAGNLEAELRRLESSRLRLKGFMDFEKNWKSYVRSEVDLMFLPHIQGDSASTYFEAMGSGVPVLGFHNRTLTPLLAAGGGGWAVATPDVSAAAAVTARLASSPGELESQARHGLSFMQRVPFEATFDERVAHFRSIAGAS